MSKCEEIVKCAINKRAFDIERENARLGMGRPSQDDRAQAEYELAPILEVTVAQFFESKAPAVIKNDPHSQCTTAKEPGPYDPRVLGDWECELFGMGRSIIVRPVKGEEPCWFNRVLQRWFFGCKWIKATKK